MTSPIAILLRPSRAFLLCFGLLIGYAALVVTQLDVFDYGDAQLTDASDVSRVEIIR